MEEWKEYKLKDVATLTTGFPFDGHKYTKDGIRVVRGDNVTIGNLRWDSDKDKRWAEPFERSAEYTLYAEDIVIGMDGSRVGKNRAQVKKEDLPLLIAQRVACVRHNELSIQKYLYYQIFSDSFEQYIKAVQTGTSIPHVSLKQIGDFPIVLPSISKQKRIAEILSSLDKKIEINRRINDNLEQQAQALFKSWFVDFEPFRDQPFVESELGMIPEGWRVIELEEACTIKYGKGLGKRDLTQDGFPVFGGNGIIGFYTHFLYELPQILVSCRGAASGKIIESLPKSYVTSNSLVLELKDRSYYNYIKLLLLNNPLYDYATGSAQPQITIDNIKGIKIILPLKEVINKVNHTLENIGSIQRNNNEESRRLAELRDTLLPRLMSGELSMDGLKGQFAVSPGQHPGSKEHVSNNTAL